MTIASAPMRTSFRAKPSAGAKQNTRAPLALNPRASPHRSAAAGEHDVAHAMGGADVDQLDELRVQRDQVDAERPPGQRCGRIDLAREQLRRHRSRGDDAKPAGVGDRGDEVALRHPGHRPAHDGQIAAEDRPAARPQPVELGARHLAAVRLARSPAAIAAAPISTVIRRRRARRRCAAPAARARCIRQRSAR